jgi:proline iminopeptidase
MTPDKYTIKETYIEVGDGHTLYLHDWGNKSAKKPIFFLHGGPGGETKDKHKTMFNPKEQRVVFFDQRGSGKSIPRGETANNTTDKLIKDIETIADHLKLKQFIITGSSWGSCLALAYAIAHPKRVAGLVIGGVFTASKREINWLDKGEVKTFYPDAWEVYLERTPEKYHDNPTSFHAKQIKLKDPIKVRDSAYAYECFGSSIASLDDRFTPDNIETYDPAGIIIEMTYLENGCYLSDRHIIKNAHKITAPVWLVQGRYDMICPPITAYELHKNIPNSKLVWSISNHAAEHENWNIIRTILSEITQAT